MVYLQLFPQVAPVMIVPLREAYENYERMRIVEEEVKAATADFPEDSSPPEKSVDSSKGKGGWSPSKGKSNLMGVSKEIREIFHDRNKESKQTEKEQEKLARNTNKKQEVGIYRKHWREKRERIDKNNSDNDSHDENGSESVSDENYDDDDDDDNNADDEHTIVMIITKIIMTIAMTIILLLYLWHYSDKFSQFSLVCRSLKSCWTSRLVS